MALKKSETSQDTRTLVTVLLLLFFPLVGLILMWAWSRWVTWVKVLITVVFGIWTLLIMGIFFAVLIATINPQAQLERGRAATCVTECERNNERNVCLQQCSAEGMFPISPTDAVPTP